MQNSSSSQETQGPTMQTMSSISYNSSSTSKYGGIIKKTMIKQLRKDLSLLFSYIHSVSPSFGLVHNIITILRLLQFAGPCFCVRYSGLWSTKDYSYQTLSIISIFWHLIPPDHRQLGGFFFLIIYICLVFFVVLLLVLSAKYFKINASLPSLITFLVSFYFSTFGFILHPVGIQMGFAQFGRVIFLPTSRIQTMNISILIIFAIVVSIAYFWIYLKIASQSLLFKPNSMQSTSSTTQNLFFASQLLITIMTSFVEAAPPVVQLILLIASALLYLGSIRINFYLGGIINHFVGSGFIATCISSCLMCTVNAAMIYLKKEAIMAFLIIYLVVFFITFIISLVYLKNRSLKHIELLDVIMDNAAAFESVNTVNKFVNMTIDGFRIAHPICIRWELLKYGIEKWPTDPNTWFIYAKFIAIYPEETQTLWWIFRSLISNKVHGAAARTVKEQSMSIARQRESNLSPDLKNMLNSVSKHLTSTKHKLRHVWDLAIQGNIGDMESATKRSIKEIEQSDAELLHVLRMFPNNRFVTRHYARFCHELKADHKMSSEMIEKTRQLQRGITVNKDQAHEFGLETFENLPEKVNVSKDSAMSMNTISESATMSQIDLETDDDNNQETEESLALVNKIDHLVIPSTRYTMIIRIMMFACLFLVPVITLLIVLDSFVAHLSSPMTHIFDMSILRTYIYMLVSFSDEEIFEYLGFFPSPRPTSSRLPASVGSSWITKDQLTFVTTQTTISMQNLEKFRTFSAPGSIDVTKAQSYIFDAQVPYLYFSGITPDVKQVTVLMAVADMISQQSILIAPNSTLPPDIVNTSVMNNPLLNFATVNKLLDNSINSVIAYIDHRHKNYSKLFIVIMIIVLIVIVTSYIAFIITQLTWIEKNKIQIYRCLTSLPKNAVSNLTENLRVLKKEENSSSSNANTEMNKQEDNIMKIFITGGTNSNTKIIDSFLLILCTIIVVGMHVGCTFVILLNAISLSKLLRTSCVHINNIQGAFGLEMGAQLMVLIMQVKGNSTVDPFLVDKKTLVEKFKERIQVSIDYYHKARFGGATNGETPYSGFNDGVDYATSLVECENPFKIEHDFLKALQCYSADLIFVMIEGLWNARVIPYEFDDTKDHIQWDMTTYTIWSELIFPIYDAMFEPMTREMVNRITQDLNDLRNSVIPGIIVMIAVAFIFEIVAVIQTIRIQTHMQSVLMLLLHVPPRIVMATSRIMSILSGCFTNTRNESATRKTEFFHAVVMNLPDVVIVFDQENNVISVNSAITRLLGLNPNEVIGKKMNEFFNSRFSPNAISLTRSVESANNNLNNNSSNNTNNNTNNNQINESSNNLSNSVSNNLNKSNYQKNQKVENITYKKDISSSELTMEAVYSVISGLHVVVLRDITQTVRYNTLINEEKNLSDVLLNSILPANLVNRVQSGEKNISFAVQSATIVFMDIVSFTPWCGSLPADKVMSTLNNLFKKLDALVAMKSTMTKIKCIGDCYMAAGGVFAEVNQPSEHAKEVVNFGLDALDEVTKLNQELDESLKIRVGINTGGPIVAGVLGIGKPTFEILGPVINMAQQMEHHGVPMAVHISRSVYELIYGDCFIIKERGSIEVKNGTVITYLVVKRE